MRRILIISIFAIGLVSGCKVGPNFQSPEPTINTEYVYQEGEPDTVLNIAWWEVFQDSALHTLIETGLVKNRDLKLAAARIEESQATVGFTKADIYPTFGYGASYNGGNIVRGLTGEDPASGSTQNIYAINLPTLSWELDFWGKFRRSTEAARADLLSSEFNRRKIQISLISQIANSYFLLLDYDNKLHIARRSLAVRREGTRILQERFNKGYVAEIDLNQAQIQEALAARSIPVYERLVAQTENALSVLIGENPGPIIRGDSLIDQAIPPDIPSGIPSQLLKRRPDIYETEAQLAAATARIGVAQAARFPAFSLTAALGSVSPELNTLVSGESLIWQAGASLVGPLFNFGKNKRRVEIQQKRAEQALYSYEQSVLQSFREVEDALIGVRTYKDELDAQDKRLAAAINANKLSRERYDGGVTSYLEVITSETSLFNAELARSTTLRERLQAYVLLYKALGGGWISEEEQQAANQSGSPDSMNPDGQ
jgi:multidrug efflux system outer membrane protein